MNINVGTPDRAARILAGTLVIVMGYYFNSWWGTIGIVLIITGLVRWCPAYSLMRMSTLSKSQKSAQQEL